jgi:ferritin-like metal-binding protein YciE
MKVRSLRDQYTEQLQSLYDAEHQVIKALPTMASAASSDELRIALDEHLAATREHPHRIEAIFERMGGKPRGGKNGEMESLLSEVRAIIARSAEHAVTDAALIAGARRVEQYEIAGYACVLAHAMVLKDDAAAAYLARTLKEEENADRILSDIAKRLERKTSAEQGHSENPGSDPRSKRSSMSVA